MYSTSSEHTRVPWAAHCYNVAFSDEIGHFEYCNAITGEGGDCTDNGEAHEGRRRRRGCFSPALSLLVTDRRLHRHRQRLRRGLVPAHLAGVATGRRTNGDVPEPVLFSSPPFNGGRTTPGSRSRRTCRGSRRADFGGICDRITGANCVNPPPGSNFYPFYSTGPEKATSGRAAASSRRTAASGSSAAPASRERRTTSAATRRTSSGRCSSASIRARTRQRGCGRTTSATCSAPTPAPPRRVNRRTRAPSAPSSRHTSRRARGRRALTAPRSGCRCSSASGSPSRRRTRAPR